MKITKKLHEEISSFLDSYWSAYFAGDLEMWSSFIPDDYRNIGTTNEEIWSSKKDILDYTNSVLDQMVGQADFQNKKIEIISYEPYLMVHELGDLYVKNEGEWVFYAPFRLSSILSQIDDGWQVLHQHGSYPDSRTVEGEAFAVDALKAENKKLLAAVAKRTKELEEKNTALEIEAALERVRSMAMGMQLQQDLLKVCKQVYRELQSLGFSNGELRNAQIVINNDDKGVYYGYQHSALQGSEFAEVPYTIHPTVTYLRDQLKKSDEAFVDIAIKGKKLADWKDFVNNFPQKHDKELNAATELHYYFYSVGIGALGISSYRQLPAEKIALLHRFSNVFNLAYQRYEDITQAEAQAREAQIELGLERVRARTMAMQYSNELAEATEELHQQLSLLGIIPYRSNIAIVNQKSHLIKVWSTTNKGKVIPASSSFPIKGHPYAKKMFDAWKNKSRTIIKSSGKARVEWTKYIQQYVGFTEYQKNKADLKKIESEPAVFSIFSFKQGYFIIHTLVEMIESDQNIIDRFAKVFEQTYTRFLDLQKAEAQAREAQIELGLERVRARAMAMQKSEELAELSMELVKQVQALGIDTWFCAFNINDDDGKGSMEWGSNGQGTFPRYRTPREGVFLRYYKAGQRGETLFINVIDENECPSHYEYLCSLPGVGEQLLQMKADGIPFPTSQIDHVAFFKYGYILFITFKPAPEAHDIFKRFAKVFEQTYTRFLDLQKAEAQTRKAQIEVAVERVRAKALAMDTSNQMIEVVATLRDEMLGLEIPGVAAATIYLKEPKGYVRMWDLTSVEEMADGFHVALDVKFKLTQTDPNLFIRKVWNGRKKYFLVKQEAKDMAITLKWLKQHNPEYAAQAAQFFKTNTWQYVLHPTVQLANGKMSVDMLDTEPPAEMESILVKMGAAFDLAYKRFLDLQKAEEQAREAKIEAAMEKVRSRSMAMQQSTELNEVAVLLHQEMRTLGTTQFLNCGYVEVDEPENIQRTWMTNLEGGETEEANLPLMGDPVVDERYKSWRKQEPLFHQTVGDKALSTHLEFAIPFFGSVEREVMVRSEFPSTVTFYCANFPQGYLHIVSGTKLTADEEDILIRFTKVFKQAYTRFLDLQQAEAQAREGEIELALERVRSHSMAMHNSEELKEVVKVIFDQMAQLKINAEHAGIVVDFEPKKDFHFWVADNQDIPARITVPYLNLVWDKQFTEAKQKGQEFFTTQLDFEEKNSFYKKLLPHIKGLTKTAKDFYLSCPGLSGSTVIQKDIGIYIENFSGTPFSDEDNSILERFGKVFQQTYTRFLDLQKAEAQAREAQIEAALERVRSRSMGMQSSDELVEASDVMFAELNKLEIDTLRIGICTIDAENGAAEIWSRSEIQGKTENRILGVVPAGTHPVFDNMVKAWKDDKPYFSSDRVGDEVRDYYEKLAPCLSYPIPNEYNERETVTAFFFPEGSLNVITLEPLNQEESEIMVRFARVFGQMFRRFLDLQIAESQTREAQIETALERVRARALAMQKPEELRQVAKVLRKEMGALGIEELETSSIFINDDVTPYTECWYALWDIGPSKKKLVTDHFKLDLKDTWVGRKMLKFYNSAEDKTSIVMKGNNRVEWIHYCEKQSKILRGYYGEKIPDRTYQLYKFSHGAIGAATEGDISEESWKLLSRTASVLTLAYSRFKDLSQAKSDLQKLKKAKTKAEKALDELKSTQTQLVHAEKMASLGELTAGIAHEIQNPLNFVNNFSDVNKELMEELLEELAKGDTAEVKAIAQDILNNDSKIVHHGKRAEGIVKGMLQHSRSNTGEKELTDLNQLADEYLRLSYHGLRAKDKSFNADFKLDLDENLPKVNVVPQDIGRVLLNLINNAFFAVRGSENPLVTVSTEQIPLPGGLPAGQAGARSGSPSILITVTDNGPGIPDDIKDKIFEPFFTTKPTGQGTGLGLSMSYDIITKGHSGNLIVETEQGKGSKFLITLNVS